MEPVDNAPHTLDNPEVSYSLVIPTRGRWRPANIVNPRERCLRNVKQPFILEKTLSFLSRQNIPKDRVWLFVSDAEEQRCYRDALKGSSWQDVRIVVGVPGIKDQRNYIVKYFSEQEYIVSIDDDVSDVLWKHRPGVDIGSLRSLPDGALERLIFDAHHRMKTYRSFICGLSCTAGGNSMTMHADGISTRNGEINGFLYFFINRHSQDLLPSIADATEDAERSLRYFNKDKRVLRYRMYCGKTRCFQNLGGLQNVYGEWGEHLEVVNMRRKEKEREAAKRLHEVFPELTGLPRTKNQTLTLEVYFKPKGGAVIPSTTVEALQKCVLAEREVAQANKQRREQKRLDADATTPASDQAETPADATKPVPDQAETPADATKPAPDQAETPADATTPALDQAETPVANEVETPIAHPGHSAGDVLDVGDSDIDSEESASDDEGFVDEDTQLLDALRVSRNQQSASDQSLNEQQMIVDAVLASYNGDFDDPMQEALRASEETYQNEKKRRADQDYLEADMEIFLAATHAKAARISKQGGSSCDSIQPCSSSANFSNRSMSSSSCSSSSSSSDSNDRRSQSVMPLAARRDQMEGGLGGATQPCQDVTDRSLQDELEKVDTLVAMGFTNRDAVQKALSSAGGELSHAAAILVSAAEPFGEYEPETA